MIDLIPRRAISPEAFALLGAPDIAYVKPVVTDHGAGFGIYSANGKEMAVVADRDVAFALVRQHDMEPVSVH